MNLWVYDSVSLWIYELAVIILTVAILVLVGLNISTNEDQKYLRLAAI